MAVRIGLGLADFPFSSADAFWRWVDLCEDGDIDSLWQTDRLVSKVPFLECMSTMGALAGRTEKLKFGMNVIALGFREPLVIAKECATIDFLSNGRLLPGFGIGNLNSPDWPALGISTEGQGARTDEALAIISALWRGETVTFKGKYFQYEEAFVLPMPVQQPLPLWLGGSSKPAIRRTGKFGTGWQAGFETPEECVPVLEAIKKAAAEEGREIDPEHFSAGFFYRFGAADDAVGQRRREAYRKMFPNRDPDQAIVIGDAEAIIRRVREYVSAGVAKFILRPIGEGDEDILEQTRLLTTEVLPEIHGRSVAEAAAQRKRKAEASLAAAH